MSGGCQSLILPRCIKKLFMQVCSIAEHSETCQNLDLDGVFQCQQRIKPFILCHMLHVDAVVNITQLASTHSVRSVKLHVFAVSSRPLLWSWSLYRWQHTEYLNLILSIINEKYKRQHQFLHFLILVNTVQDCSSQLSQSIWTRMMLITDRYLSVQHPSGNLQFRGLSQTSN